MKEIELTQGKVALVDDEDFEKVNTFKWYAQFNGRHWYAKRSIRLQNGKQSALPMHRYLMGLEREDLRQVDHKNRVGTLDNRRSTNLRVATKVQNRRNQGKYANNSSGFKGVHWDKSAGQWQAKIRGNGKDVYLGLFPTAELGAQAYDAAAIEYHGEYAVTNASLGLLKKLPQSVPALAMQQQNRGMHRNNTSGFKGVTWHKASKKWRAQMKVNGKKIHLGVFTTPELAAMAYDVAVPKYHGENAITNTSLGFVKKQPRSVAAIAVAA